MTLRIGTAAVVTWLAALGCGEQAEDTGLDSALAGTAGTGGAVNGGGSTASGTAGAVSTSAGTDTGGGGAGGASTGAGGTGVPLGGCSGGGCTGSAGAMAAGGSGGEPARQLRRVLAYNHVDINPDTGKLRGHTGGGGDEKLLQALATEHGFELVVTDQAADFSSESLAGFDVVAFASPDYVGQVLSASQRSALEAFVRQGGGWVGWHYALWIEKDWPFMRVLGGGALAKGHVGAVQPMTFTVVDGAHPIMKGMPHTFDVKDDFLAMTADPGQDPQVSVLVRAALTAAPGGNDRPVVWAHQIGKGRAYYSMLGHSAGGFSTPEAKTLMWNALRWVAPSKP